MASQKSSSGQHFSTSDTPQDESRIGPLSSSRKIEANRQNAKKSTGPTTPKGKAYSRRNALKHGFFAGALSEQYILQTESPKKFQAFYNALREDWQPVGIREELEVRRIAISWVKLQRAWQFENAELQLQLGAVAGLAGGLDSREKMDPDVRTLLNCLEEAVKQIEADGQISPEVKEKIFANELLRRFWPDPQEKLRKIMQRVRKEYENNIPQMKGVTQVTARAVTQSIPEKRPGYTRMKSVLPFQFAMQQIQCLAYHRRQRALGIAYNYKSIPDGEALDKTIRYDAAAERQLARASDRLEQLQRRRKGEISHSVHVRLS